MSERERERENKEGRKEERRKGGREGMSKGLMEDKEVFYDTTIMNHIVRVTRSLTNDSSSQHSGM